jgi:immune inhibitor A
MAAKTGKSPRAFKHAPSTQTAKLLTVLVEFNPNANDDFSGFERPAFVGAEDCVTEPPGTLLNGPLHNNLPDPATFGRGTDNNTFWVPDFRPSHYNKLIYTKTGLTQRVRPDLTGPDGRPGIDLRGYTVKNHYREMSKGAYDITGGVAGWVQVPHSEAYYGATPCGQAIQANTGHPDNPRQVGQLVVDAVDALAASDPSFPWADYDIEDQGDVDGDGNLFEPDGVIDHFVIIHAGADKADDGGAEGTYAIWSHASNVDPATGGYAVPGTGVKVNNYIMQAEDAGVGVVSHEFGHDLGLPDLYDTSGAAESDVDFWDLMSSGSHTGPLFQSIPVHMGPVGQVRARLGRPGDLRGRLLGPRRQGRPDLADAQGDRGRHPGEPAPEDGDPGHAAQRREHVVLEQRPVLGRRQAVAHPRNARRGRRALLVLGQLRHRGAVGLRLHRGLDRRRVDLDPARGPRRGRQRGLDQRRPQRAPARLRRPPERPHRLDPGASGATTTST